jgi:hypothetical protein
MRNLTSFCCASSSPVFVLAFLFEQSRLSLCLNISGFIDEVDKNVVTDLDDMRKNHAAFNLLTQCCLLELRFKHDFFEMIIRSTSTMTDDMLAKIEAKMLQVAAKPSAKQRYSSSEPLQGARKVKPYDQLKERSRRTILACIYRES